MKVSELLSDESKWCKEESSLDKYGYLVAPSSSRACRWCLLGACTKIYHDVFNNRSDIADKINVAIRKLYPELSIAYAYTTYNNMIRFNDDSRVSFDMVKKVIEEAGV